KGNQWLRVLLAGNEERGRGMSKPTHSAQLGYATPAMTLGLAAASWVVAVRQMSGMDMGVATRLGSFAFFVALWVSMMGAMGLPRERPFGIRVRALLRRLEHRTDADAAGGGRHERHLDDRDRRPRPRPEAPARESRRRCAAGAGDRRTWSPYRHRTLVGSRSH